MIKRPRKDFVALIMSKSFALLFMQIFALFFMQIFLTDPRKYIILILPEGFADRERGAVYGPEGVLKGASYILYSNILLFMAFQPFSPNIRQTLQRQECA